MTTGYNGTNGGAFPNLISGPADKEKVTGASVGLVAQSAANQDKHIWDSMTRVAYTNAVHGFNGRKAMRRARIVLTDASQTVKVSTGDSFELVTPASPRVITLDHSIDSPLTGEELEFTWYASGSPGGGVQWTFKREDATIVATFEVSTVGGVTNPLYHAVFVRAGGVWRLGANSGCSYDGTTNYGVVPGLSA